MSPDGARWAFKYDHNGLRTEREYSYSGEVILRSEYTWVDEKLVKEERRDGMNTLLITLEYFYNDEDLIGFSIQEGDAAAVNYYYGKTNNGEIRFIYDSNGNIVTTYLYDAWGNPIPTDESSDSEVGRINPFRYKSYYYDSETRLYYLRSRSYDPVVGRFLNADSTDYLGTTQTLLSYNLFAYCENNPVNIYDLNGFLAASTIAKIILGCILGFFVQLVGDLITNAIYMYMGKSGITPLVSEYISSMLSYSLIFLTANKKVFKMLIDYAPYLVKHIGRIITGNFNLNVLLIDLGTIVVSYIVSYFLGKSLQNKIQKLKSDMKHSKVAKMNFNANKIVLKNTFKIWGIRISFGITVSNSIIQTVMGVILS